MLKTKENLQQKGIRLLKENGMDEDLLWLCEIQSIKQCARFYGEDFIMRDLTANKPKEHTHIVYFHESGAIRQSATFNPKNEKSFNEACKFIAS